MTAVVDYGVGNLFSLTSSLRALGLETEVTAEADRLRAAERIILPGVGAFGDARAKLDATGLAPVLRETVAGPDMEHIPYPVTEDMIYQAMEAVERMTL